MNIYARDQILQRLKPNTPYRDHFQTIVHGAFDCVLALEGERDRIAKDANLSDVGRRTILAEAVQKTFSRDLCQISRNYRLSKAQNATRRAALKPKPLDKSDTVGELRRQEIRTYLRKLPDVDKLRAADELALDADAFAAVVDAPPALSGFNGRLKPQFDELRTRYMHQHFGPQIDELDAQGEDIATVGAAVEMAMGALRQAAGMNEAQFNTFIEPIQAETDKPR